MLPLLFILTINLFPQVDCSKLISTTTDKMTGEIRTGIIKPIIIKKGNSSFVIDMYLARKDAIFIVITASAPYSGCVDDNAEIDILFRDQARIKRYTFNKFNCDGTAALLFEGSLNGDLINLKSKNIATIRVNKTKSDVQLDFAETQADLFRHCLACLYDKM
jgi:hypothetical protein